MDVNLRGVFLGLILSLSPAIALAQLQDVEGSKDHPLISRDPGSIISTYSTQEFDEYQLVLGPGLGSEKFEKSQRLEGKVTLIRYVNLQGRSTLEIFRNYEMALKRAGFQVLFSCNLTECGQTTNHPGLDYLAWKIRER